MPDASYDLDGDGHIGQMDYVVSKLHDLDKDNKLNQSERKAALKAIEDVSFLKF